jgi:ABC-type multidrug transport system fused ATPase/permease subunit
MVNWYRYYDTGKLVIIMRHLLRAFRMVKNQWGRRILAGIGMLGDSAGLILLPLVIRNVFDTFTSGQPLADSLSTIRTSALYLLILAVTRFIFVYVEIYFQEGTGNYISHDLRKLLFKRILHLPFSFFDTKKTGDLMSVLTRDVDAVRDGTGFVIMLILVNAMIVIGITIAMLIMHPLLTLIIFATFPLLGILAVWYARRIGPLYQSLQKQSGRLHTTAQENVSGIRVVKAFTREPEAEGKFGHENEQFYQLGLKIARLSSTVHPTMDFLGSFSGMVALAASGYFVIKGEISLGTMIAFTSFAENLIWPVRQIGWLSEMFQRAIAGAERIFQIVDAEDALDSLGEPIVKNIDGDINFNNVSFAYPNGEEAVADFSLTIPKGSTVCLLGMTGSGKTTIANLLARFYDPTEGNITIDGIDIRRWDLSNLRSQIGFVFQDNYLFSTTLRDNITMGEQADEEQLRQAIEAAQAQSFIDNLPDGLDTIVGERGIGLSGGERQRIAIARAILQGPPILIFDDSSASLDMKTEASLQQALNDLYQGRTVIVIAQRVTTAQSADHVVVLDGGRIVEQGTHQELLAKNGVYTELYRIQSENMSLLVESEVNSSDK